MEIILIAIALAMDSVAVSIAIGAKFKNLNFLSILKVSLYFGLFQGLMPLIGYFFGLSFAKYVDSFDHYVAFFILVFLGYKMIKEGLDHKEEDEVRNLRDKTLLILAIATSIDALAVGIAFSFQEINIYYAITIITLITFILCIFANFIGKVIGTFLENKAHFLGGIILILLGFKMLWEGV